MGFGCISLCLAMLCACEKNTAPANAQQHQQSAQRYFQQGQIQAAIFEAKNALKADSENVAAHQLLGQALLISGTPLAAIKQYQQALTLTQQTFEKCASENFLASAYLQMGQAAEAATFLQADCSDAAPQVERQLHRAELGIAQAPNNPTAFIATDITQALNALLANAPAKLSARIHILLAQIALLDNTDSERFNVAEKAVSAALTVDTESSDALIWQGHLRLAQQRYAEAENSYAKALLQLQGYDVMTHARFLALEGMVKALVGQNKTNEALRFNQMMSASPQGKLFADYQNAIANFQQGQVTQATQALQKVVASAPGLTPAQNALGMMQFAQGDYAAAETHLLASLRGDANHNAFLFTALAQWQQGKTAQMIVVLQQALKQAVTPPLQADLLALLGLAYLREGQLKLSQQTLLQSEQQQPTHRATQLALAQWEQQQKQYAAAQTRYLRLLNNTAASAQDELMLYQQLAALENAQGKSAVDYLQALPAKTSSARSIVLLTALLHEKQWQTAETLAQTLVTAFPQNADVKGAVAATYLALAQQWRDTKPQLSLDYLQRSISLLPEHPAAYALQAHIIEKMSGFEAALAQLQSVQKNHPPLLAIQHIIGDLYARHQQADLALAAYQTAWQPRLDRISTQLDLAQVEWQLKKTDAAIHRYETILSQQPDQVEALNNLAWLYLDKNLDKAKLLAARAYQLDNHNPQVIDTYAQALERSGQPEQALLIRQSSQRAQHAP